MRVQQLDGHTFIKTLSPVESKLFERIVKEEKERLEFSYKLYGQQKKLAKAIAELNNSVGAINAMISDIVAQIQSLERAINEGGIPEQGGRSEISIDDVKSLLYEYAVEEIEAQYGMPTNDMFDSDYKKIVFVGYERFDNARLRKWPDVSARPGIAKRYTTYLYCSASKDVELSITHDDYFAVYLNGNLIKAMSGSNLSGPAERVLLSLNGGWNKVQFLVSNREYGGYFDIGVDLAKEVDIVATAPPSTGGINSEAILPGAVKPSHIDAGGEFGFKKVSVSDLLESKRININGISLENNNNTIVLNGNLKINGSLEYKALQGYGRPVTSALWLATDIYLPPARVIADETSCTGRAVFVPKEAAGSVIACPNGEMIHPGKYKLYMRIRPTQTSGSVATVNITADGTVLKSAVIDGTNLNTAEYRTVTIDFTHNARNISIELLPAGVMDFYIDTIGIQMEV